MSSTFASSRLELPYVQAGQSQIHVTHNEALRSLDALLHLRLEAIEENAPPAQVVDDIAYGLGAAPSGVWANQPGKIAVFQDGIWEFYSPAAGFIAVVGAMGTLHVHDGTSWNPVSGGGGGLTNPTAMLGVNATADQTNRLSVRSASTLFDAENGDHRLTVNKAAIADTASLVFQNAYAGQAEMGLAGSDDFSIKVRGDDNQWREAMVVNRNNGSVAWPNTSGGGSGGGIYAQRAMGTLQTAFTTTSSDWAGVGTGLSVTLTPSSVSSQIEIAVSTALGATFDNSEPQVRVYRNGLKVWPQVADFATLRVYLTGNASHYALMPMSILFVDQPASTAPVTYELHVRSPNGGTVHVNRRHIASPEIFESVILAKELAQ